MASDSERTPAEKMTAEQFRPKLYTTSELQYASGEIDLTRVDELMEAYAAQRVSQVERERDEAISKLSRCGQENCFGQVVDGVKTWVTKDRLEQAKSEIAALQERVRKLERGIRIVSAPIWVLVASGECAASSIALIPELKAAILVAQAEAERLLKEAGK